MDNVFFHSQNRKLDNPIPPVTHGWIGRYYYGIDSQYSYVIILSYNLTNSKYELIVNDSYGDEGHWKIIDVTNWKADRKYTLSPSKGNSYLTLLPINNKFYACWVTADRSNIGSIYSTSGSNNVNNPRLLIYNITDNHYINYTPIEDSNGNWLTSATIRKFYFLTLSDWLWIEDTKVYYRGSNWKSQNNSTNFYQIDTSGDSKSMTSFAGNNYVSPNNYSSGILTNLKFVMKTVLGGFSNYSDYPGNYSDSMKTTQSKLLYSYRLYGDKYVLIGNKEPGRISGGFDIAGTADYKDGVKQPKNLIINLADTNPNKVEVDAHYYLADGTEIPFNGSFSGAYYGSYDPNNPMDSSFGRETYKSCRAISPIKMSHKNKDNPLNNNYYLLQHSAIKREIHLKYDSIGGVLGDIFHVLATFWTGVANVLAGCYNPYDTFGYFGDDYIYMDTATVALFKTSDLTNFNCISKQALKDYPPFDFTVSKNTDRVICLGGRTNDNLEGPNVAYFSDDDFSTYTICDFQFQ